MMIDKDEFIKRILQMHYAGDWGDIDGGDMDEIYRKLGFTERRIVTEDDFKSYPEWIGECGYDVGDTADFWTAEVREFLSS